MGRDQMKKLAISAPVSVDTVNSQLKSNVILICKYGFAAENKHELSVKKGDVLKLLDRPGNGWILVKFIDTVSTPGLIPASYVDIAINDPINPIMLQWLYETQETLSEPLMAEIKGLLGIEGSFIADDEPYPVSTSISNVLLLEERYWYRLDIAYSDNTKSFIGRYYQDFYNLHISFLDLVSDLSLDEDGLESLKLPKLPGPIPSNNDLDPSELVVLLLKRCNVLNIYMNRLLMNKNFQLTRVLTEWMKFEHKDIDGFTENDESAMKLSNNEINSKILSNSVNVINGVETAIDTYPEEEKSIIDSPIEPVNIPQRNRSHYNHYQQINLFQGMKRPPPNLKLNTPMNVSCSSPSELSVFSSTGYRSPDTPMSDHFPRQISKHYVKCKVILGHGDIVAMKINKLDIKSPRDIKNFVGRKTYFKHLFVKLHEYVNIDSSNFNLIEYLNDNDKIILKTA